MNNISSLRKAAGISQAELGKAIGVAQNTVSAWEKGVRQPDNSCLRLLAEYFSVSVDEVLGYSGAVSPASSANAYRVPVLGRVAAGLPLLADEEIIDWEELPNAWRLRGDYFGLVIKGQSMEPRMCEGDVVIIRKQESCESGQTAIVMVNGDEATCKRVVYHDNGLSLVSYNPVFPPQFYTSEEVEKLPVRIIGIVAELRAKIN